MNLFPVKNMKTLWLQLFQLKLTKIYKPGSLDLTIFSISVNYPLTSIIESAVLAKKNILYLKTFFY